MTTRSIDTEHCQNTDTPSATVRGWALLIAAVGAIGCLTPLWPLGAGMVAVGLYIAPATKIVEPVETKALSEASETGDGRTWLWLAICMVVAIGLVGIAMLGAAVESGAIR